MITNITDDIWKTITDIFNSFEELIMNNYDEPFLWIAIFVILLVIAFTTISSLANK